MAMSTSKGSRRKSRAGVQRKKRKLPQLGVSHDSDKTTDVMSGDEFAAQLVNVVFEWRPARASSAPRPVSELWMSRSARRSQRTAS